MTMSAPHNPADAIRAELDATRAVFHEVLSSFSEEDFHRPSLNPGWSNGEILAHMLFGFILLLPLLPLARLWGRLPRGSSRGFAWLLNASTRPFNSINAWGARMQGRVFTKPRIGKLYDRVHAALLRMLATIRADEWERGMHYPTRWDANFSDFMTLEALFHYPVVHFQFHLKQLSHTTP